MPCSGGRGSGRPRRRDARCTCGGRHGISATDRRSNFRTSRRRPGHAILLRFYTVVVAQYRRSSEISATCINYCLFYNNIRYTYDNAIYLTKVTKVKSFSRTIRVRHTLYTCIEHCDRPYNNFIQKQYRNCGRSAFEYCSPL